MDDDLRQLLERLESRAADIDLSPQALRRLRREVEEAARLRELERALSNSDKHLAELEAIYTSAPVGLCVLDTELRYVRVNERLAEINGLPAADHIGRTFREVVPSLAPQAEALMRRIIETGEPVHAVEVSGVTAAERSVERVWKAQWLPLDDESGRVVGINGVVEEITELKRAEAALKVSEQRYRELVAHAPVAIYEVGFHPPRLLSVNDTMCHFLGYSREELLAMSPLDLLDEEGKALFLDRIRRQMAGEAPDTKVDYRIAARDGRVYHATLDVSFTRGPDGTPLGATVVTHDVTERMKAEAELRESETRYRSLFEHMLDGFAYCRMRYEDGRPVDFTYLAVNAAFERLTGLRDVVGRAVSEVIPNIRRDNPELFEIYGRVAMTGLPERFETYLPALGIWFSVSVYSPEREHFVAVFDNITARKRAEEELRDSQQRLSMIVDSIADGFYVLDRDWRLTHVNDTVLRHAGRAREEILGRSLFEVWPDVRRVANEN